MSAEPPTKALQTAGAELDPLLGRVIDGRYRVLEQIGHGGMGRVYKVLQAPLDRLVALKILGAGYDSDRNFYKRFFLEASVTAKLTHPNTIKVYDYGGTGDGIFFIAMEFLNGRNLSEAMQHEGPFAQERVLHIAQQICRSLREAHALGIIHRDLKPANVMLLRQEDELDFVKVLDFGLVKFFSGDNREINITNQGTFVGSPHYIAPEQARNQSPDQRCDVYSLGVVLYQMLTGRVPFTARAPVDIILKHLREPPVPPRELRPDLNIAPELQHLVLTCLAKKREDRYQSMDELLACLKILRRRLAGVAKPNPMPPYGGAGTRTPPTPHPEMRTPSQPMRTSSPPAEASEDPPGGQPRLTSWIAERKDPSLAALILPALPGVPATPVTMDWLIAFCTLHERAQTEDLGALDLARYYRERAFLSNALLMAQRLSMKPGDPARKSLRVATNLPVDLDLGRSAESTKTLDLTLGGFAVLLNHPPRVGARIAFSIELSSTGPLSGSARVVNLQSKRRAFRVGFAFEDLSLVDATRINFEVFDGVLSGFSSAQPEFR